VSECFNLGDEVETSLEMIRTLLSVYACMPWCREVPCAGPLKRSAMRSRSRFPSSDFRSFLLLWFFGLRPRLTLLAQLSRAVALLKSRVSSAR